MGDEGESSSPDPREQGVADAAAGRGPEGDEVWSDEEWHAYFESYWETRHAKEPARAPAAWPVALALIAANTAVAGTEMNPRKRWWSAMLVGGGWGLLSERLIERAERHQARRLGLQSAGEQPSVPTRLTLPPTGGAAFVCIPFPARTCLFSVLFGFGLGLLHGLNRQREIAQTWEGFLARQLCYELLRRYDWRRAGGPTRPATSFAPPSCSDVA